MQCRWRMAHAPASDGLNCDVRVGDVVDALRSEGRSGLEELNGLASVVAGIHPQGDEAVEVTNVSDAGRALSLGCSVSRAGRSVGE